MKLGKYKKLFAVPSGNPDLALAQFEANKTQLPMMYCLLLVNTWALVISFWSVAPRFLTLYIPLVLTAVCVLRLFKWWGARNVSPTPEMALKALRRTNILAIPIAVAFSGWCLALFPYGDAYAQGHIAFYMAITVVGCIFCLMHILSAAFYVTVAVNAAFIVYFGISGVPGFTAMAINLILVTGVLLAVVSINYERLVSLIVAQKVQTIQQKALEQRQKETQKLSDENFRLANLDSLTDLPNRRSFFGKLEKNLADLEYGGAPLAIGVLDLDGFKAVNDLYGHAVGDGLLKAVADRLRGVACDDVFLSRLGGDEFGILIQNESSDERLQDLGNKICSELSTPFKHQDVELRIGGSIGLAKCPPTGASPSRLYELADYALYQVKKESRGQALIFGAEHQAAISRTRLVERGFYETDFANQISIVFQPVVDVDSNGCIAFEALARWQHPLLGNVPPDTFIGIAERCGFIDRLTEMLFEKALNQAKTWPEHIRLSFNLSAKNIATLQHADRLATQIRESGFDPSRIDFEITETAMIQDFEQVHTVMSALKRIGVRISLDDFGTGFSSLKHLHSFPLDKIKIDRSFVTNIHSGSAGYGIVKSLLNLSREMGIGCIVEGVETEEELAVVKSLGGSLVQGYYYSRPLGGEQVAAFLNDQEEHTAMAS
ncbi:putative bifunctional diguanylate cyclase/phosphodiesterase [Roseibium sp.]|uniref:putative bifunctional diguanylate cyclase/phosphodiesterase n=1 Tax=Roseibium sp. TaxID=1936156 RepID=UPI003A9729E6